MKNTKLDELRDIIALDKYGKLYTALPDDGAEQDYVAGEADRRMKLTCTPAVAAVEPVRGELEEKFAAGWQKSIAAGSVRGELDGGGRLTPATLASYPPITGKARKGFVRVPSVLECAADALDGFGCENADYYRAEFAKIERNQDALLAALENIPASFMDCGHKFSHESVCSPCQIRAAIKNARGQ